MRNITKEAIEKAEKTIIEAYPSLKDELSRVNLPPLTKAQVITELLRLYDYYEEQLIEEIKNEKHIAKTSRGQTNQI